MDEEVKKKEMINQYISCDAPKKSISFYDEGKWFVET